MEVIMIKTMNNYTLKTTVNSSAKRKPIDSKSTNSKLALQYPFYYTISRAGGGGDSRLFIHKYSALQGT